MHTLVPKWVIFARSDLSCLPVHFRFELHVDEIWDYAADIVKERVDAISAGGDLGIRAAQKATQSTPSVGVTDDMLRSGFVTSLARPNGNTTGVSILAPELDGKRQEILIEALPGLHHLAILANSNTTKQAPLDDLQRAARARDIEVSVYWITKSDEIVPAIDDRLVGPQVNGGNIWKSCSAISKETKARQPMRIRIWTKPSTCLKERRLPGSTAWTTTCAQAT